MPNRPTALRPDIGSDVVNSRSRADAAFHNPASVRAADSDARDLGPVRRSGPVYDKAVFRKVAPRRPEVLGGGASLLAVPYAITGGLAAPLGPRRAPRPRHDVGCSWWCFGPSWHQLY